MKRVESLVDLGQAMTDGLREGLLGLGPGPWSRVDVEIDVPKEVGELVDQEARRSDPRMVAEGLRALHGLMKAGLMMLGTTSWQRSDWPVSHEDLGFALTTERRGNRSVLTVSLINKSKTGARHA